MVSMTLAIPDEIKQEMEKFSEINWSGFVRKAIIEKTKELTLKEEMLKKFEEENELDSWAVELGKKAKEGRFNLLKKKGLV